MRIGLELDVSEECLHEFAVVVDDSVDGLAEGGKGRGLFLDWRGFERGNFDVEFHLLLKTLHLLVFFHEFTFQLKHL